MCAAGARLQNRSASFFGASHGAAMLLDIADRNAIAAHEADVAVAPPGSTDSSHSL